MHKRSTNRRKYSKEILSTFFSYETQADMLFIKILPSRTASLEFFFFLLFQKLGSVRRWEMKHFIGMALTMSIKPMDDRRQKLTIERLHINPGGGGTSGNFCCVCATGISEPLPHYSLFLVCFVANNRPHLIWAL